MPHLTDTPLTPMARDALQRDLRPDRAQPLSSSQERHQRYPKNGSAEDPVRMAASTSPPMGETQFHRSNRELGNNDNDAELKLREADLDRCAERMIAIPNPFARLAYWLEALLQEGRQT